MLNVKIPIALDRNSNKLIHISEITKNNINNFNFVCPVCKTELIARMGDKNTHHFSHKSGCDINGETIVHLLAKKIISENNKIVVPIYNPVTLEWQKIEHEYKFIGSEMKYGDVTPDVVIEVKGRPIFIEVANTHFIDEEKLEKLRNIGIETWEIEISSKLFFKYELLKDNILNDTCFKKLMVFHENDYRGYLNNNCIRFAKNNLLYNKLVKQYQEYKSKNITIDKNEKFPLLHKDNYFRLGDCDDCERDEYWIKIEKSHISKFNNFNVLISIYNDVKNNLDDYWCALFSILKHSYRYKYIVHVPESAESNPFGNFEKEHIEEIYKTIEYLLNKKANNLLWDKFDYGYSLYTPII